MTPRVPANGWAAPPFSCSQHFSCPPCQIPGTHTMWDWRLVLIFFSSFKRRSETWLMWKKNDTASWFLNLAIEMNDWFYSFLLQTLKCLDFLKIHDRSPIWLKMHLNIDIIPSSPSCGCVCVFWADPSYPILMLWCWAGRIGSTSNLDFNEHCGWTLPYQHSWKNCFPAPDRSHVFWGGGGGVSSPLLDTAEARTLESVL